MSRVLITGASGFIGRRLTRALLQKGHLTDLNGEPQKIRSLCLVDRIRPRVPSSQDIQIEAVEGDFADAAVVQGLAARSWDSVFHLAATLTLDAERDPAKAYAVNVEPLRRLIDRARSRPRVVFASSIAVFGGALPDVVDDDVHPSPQTTYGTHKAIAEMLIADYSRRGIVDGRALRLPIVVTRPGAPTPAISDRVASIIREPLAGRSVDVPLKVETIIPIASVGAVASALVHLHEVPAVALGRSRAMNLPSLSVTIADMIAAVSRRLDGQPADRFRIAGDPTLQAIVDEWPRYFQSDFASSLALRADADFEAVIQDHLDQVPADG